MKDKECLEHIQNAIERIKSYTENSNQDDFLSNTLLQDAILYQFTIIGEAIMYVDDELLQQYDYPWYAVRSFRNYIAHQYFGINLSKVWNTIEINLPELERMITMILQNN